MGLFDKFKNKKNKKISREEAEKHTNKMKDYINENIDVTIAGVDISDSIKKDIQQELDVNIIREYGTPEEKLELTKRKNNEKNKKIRYEELKEKYDRGKRMNDKNSIKIFNEIISEAEEFPDLIISTYHALIETNLHIRHCEDAVNAANDCISFKKVNNEDYSYELRRIDFIKNHCRPRKK